MSAKVLATSADLPLPRPRRLPESCEVWRIGFLALCIYTTASLDNLTSVGAFVRVHRSVAGRELPAIDLSQRAALPFVLLSVVAVSRFSA